MKLNLSCVLALSILSLPITGHSAGFKTRNVFLIVSDGFRWQEVFEGADERLLNKEFGKVADTNATRAQFWGTTPDERRQALLPFIWGEFARHGQLFGNQKKGSVVTVTNGKKFSYPGYNEILTGAPDPRIDSNDKKLNPNVNVFEWLNERPHYKDRVSVLGTWDVFPFIFNCERSRLPIWPAWQRKFMDLEIRAPRQVTELMKDTTALWNDCTYDSFLFHTTVDHVKRKTPRLVFVGFGETDEWAHEGRYDLYLSSARSVDDYVRRLWETIQLLPQYRGTTTFIITADHGRGGGLTDWKDHGEKVNGAEGNWLAISGPDTPPLGERTETQAHTQGQIAATIAALLGEDYRAAFPQAAKPLAGAFGGIE